MYGELEGLANMSVSTDAEQFVVFVLSIIALFLIVGSILAIVLSPFLLVRVIKNYRKKPDDYTFDQYDIIARYERREKEAQENAPNE